MAKKTATRKAPRRARKPKAAPSALATLKAKRDQAEQQYQKALAQAVKAKQATLAKAMKVVDGAKKALAKAEAQAAVIEKELAAMGGAAPKAAPAAPAAPAPAAPAAPAKPAPKKRGRKPGRKPAAKKAAAPAATVTAPKPAAKAAKKAAKKTAKKAAAPKAAKKAAAPKAAKKTVKKAAKAAPKKRGRKPRVAADVKKALLADLLAKHPKGVDWSVLNKKLLAVKHDGAAAFTRADVNSAEAFAKKLLPAGWKVVGKRRNAKVVKS